MKSFFCTPVKQVIVLVLVYLMPLCVFGQWRFVQKLNNSGSRSAEVIYVCETVSVNTEGNYVIKVKREFPGYKRSNDFYCKSHAENITTFEIRPSLKSYRSVYDEWIDANGKVSSSKDYTESNKRDLNNGWERIPMEAEGIWGKIFKIAKEIIMSSKAYRASKSGQ